MTYEPDEKLQLKVDDVVWREVGDELVILELSTSTYLTLNGTAKQLWEGLVTGTTVDALVETLTQRYKITPQHARADAQSFLAALTERDLLVHGA